MGYQDDPSTDIYGDKWPDGPPTPEGPPPSLVPPFGGGIGQGFLSDFGKDAPQMFQKISGILGGASNTNGNAGYEQAYGMFGDPTKLFQHLLGINAFNQKGMKAIRQGMEAGYKPSYHYLNEMLKRNMISPAGYHWLLRRQRREVGRPPQEGQSSEPTEPDSPDLKYLGKTF